jgi:hypothetical protein
MIDHRWYSEDPYIRAVVRGRAITASLARLVKESDEGHYWVDMRSVLSGGTPMGRPGADPDMTDGTGAILQRAEIHNEKPGDMLRHVWATHFPVFGEDHA